MTKEYKLTIGGKPYDVTVRGVSGSVADVTVNGVDYKVEIGGEASSAPTEAAAPEVQVSSRPAAFQAPSGGKKITSPLPGVIVSVNVKEGQKVSRGQKVAVIEAMKMENEILAPCDGTVSSINVDKGDSVAEGADIMTIC